jgi:hypothetical protein
MLASPLLCPLPCVHVSSHSCQNAGLTLVQRLLGTPKAPASPGWFFFRTFLSLWPCVVTPTLWNQLAICLPVHPFVHPSTSIYPSMIYSYMHVCVSTGHACVHVFIQLSIMSSCKHHQSVIHQSSVTYPRLVLNSQSCLSLPVLGNMFLKHRNCCFM